MKQTHPTDANPLTQFPPIERVADLGDGQGMRASGRIPEGDDLYGDHFPGFPVLPGVLALELLKKTAEAYWGQCPRTALREIRGVRFARFLKPGDAWQAEVRLISQEAGRSLWRGRLVQEGETAVAAELVTEFAVIS